MNTCIAPNQIESWHLDAYVDGIAPAEIAAHVENCSACQQKVVAIRKENHQLNVSLFRYNCPDPDKLLNYQWGLLNDEDALQLSVHLARCPYCSQESQQLAPSEAEDQPASWAEQAIQKFFEKKLRLFVAHLSPYQLSPVRHSEPEVAVVRGQSPTTQVYTITELDLDVILNRWIENDRTYILQGQLLGIKPDQLKEFQVGLLQDDKQLATSPLTDAGVFKFSAIKSGNYNLCFYTEQVQFYIPDIFLG